MGLWLSPRKAAQHLKEINEKSEISEMAIRRFIAAGFPCAKNGTKCLVNVDTFDDDLTKFISQRKY